MSKYFKCPWCEETFKKILTDQECKEIKEENYPYIPWDDMELVCDDCAKNGGKIQ